MNLHKLCAIKSRETERDRERQRQRETEECRCSFDFSLIIVRRPTLAEKLTQLPRKKIFLFGKVTRIFNNFAKAQVTEEILLKRDSNTGASL